MFTGTDYQLSQASGFAEAARLINSGNYDLLITDLMLGDGLGTELIKMFEKKRSGAKSLRLVALRQHNRNNGSVQGKNLLPLWKTT